MADAKSDYLERKNLDHNLGTTTFTKPTAVYVALLSSNPTDAGAGSEVTGGSYSRKTTTFTPAATNASVTSASNVSDLVWTNLPTTTISHVAIFDAPTGGNMLYHAPLTANKSVASGDGYTVSIGQLVVQEN